MLDRLGCEVSPLMASSAPSTASQPASIAASAEAAEMPLVSWVWKCTGSPVSSLSALTSAAAACGRQMPAMSLMPSTCTPACFSSRAMPT
ncbi:hypothetical protein D9M72_500140 [compost metagenome]